MKKILACLFLMLTFGCSGGEYLKNNEVEDKMTVIITRSVSGHYDPSIVITAANIYYNGNDVVIEGLKSIKTFESAGHYIVTNMYISNERLIIPIPKSPKYEVEIRINVQ